MTNTELDPLFLKGLRLLHSKSKDSAEQLKQLLDEVIAQSQQKTDRDQNFLFKSETEGKVQLKKSISRDYSDLSSVTSKQTQDDGRKREAEKRHLERTKQEEIEIIQESKIPKLDSPQMISYYSSSPDVPPKLDHFVYKKVDEDSDSSDEVATDADGFAMEMGLACVICKSLDVSQGNQLIECQECHSLYHQECHRPPATDHDVNDPRRVWYCAKCTKNMKKIASKTQKPSKPTTSVIPKEVPMQTRFTKPETTQVSSVLPFKRQELKAPISQGNHQSSTNKLIGLAGLAANFSNRVTTAASSVSSTSTTRPISAKTTVPSSSKSYGNLLSPLKTSINPTNLSSSIKVSSSTSSSVSSFGSSLMSASVPPIVISKNTTSSSTSSTAASSTKAGLGLMTTAATTSRSASQATSASISNNGAKPTAACSLFMSADKRVQIMKKRAAKMQEKRRLTTK